MRAAAYCRVSTREQVENTSLETQEQAIRAYCDREGLQLVRVFREQGESAKTADRPQLQSLLAYCASEPVDLVLVWKFDRFARELAQHVQLRAQLRGLGAEVRSITESTGDDDPAGRLLENVLAAIAQFDNDVRAQRTRRGMKAKAEQGLWLSRPPLGYRRTVDELGRSNLEPDPVRAPLVRAAFEAIAAGATLVEDVRQRLTEQGLATVTGRVVAPESFHRILRNPIYAGRIVFEKLDVDAPAAFEPIVAPELFAAVQDRLDGKGLPRRRAGDEDFPLRRFAFCAHCDRRLTGGWSRGKRRRYPYYRCSVCNGSGVRRGVLHGSFLSHLEALSLDRAYVPLFREVSLAAFRCRAELDSSERANLTRELNTVGDRERRLREAYIFERRITADVYDEESRLLQERRAGIERALRGPHVGVDAATVTRECEHLLSDLGTAWNRAPVAQRRVLQRLVYPDGVPVLQREVRTPREASVFAVLRAIEGGGQRLGSPNGI